MSSNDCWLVMGKEINQKKRVKSSTKKKTLIISALRIYIRTTTKRDTGNKHTVYMYMRFRQLVNCKSLLNINEF